MHCQCGDVANIPVLIDESSVVRINDIVDECIGIARMDWDSFEVSWDFNGHPFITSARFAAQSGNNITIRQSFEDWKCIAEDRFRKLKKNEEEDGRRLCWNYNTVFILCLWTRRARNHICSWSFRIWPLPS